MKIVNVESLDRLLLRQVTVKEKDSVFLVNIGGVLYTLNKLELNPKEISNLNFIVSSLSSFEV